MAKKGYLLGEADLQVIRTLVREEMGRVRNTTGRSPSSRPDLDEMPTTELYLVQTPASTGIAANSSAVCTVFRNDNGTPVSRGFTIKVYNLYSELIPASKYILAGREKYGTWIAIYPWLIDVECSGATLTETYG